MKYSFIIPSVDRQEALARCLASIDQACKAAKALAVEIIIVFNGVEKEGIVLANEGLKDKLSVYYIDKMGVSLARNLGIRKSKGDYLIFLDDDATINSDFLSILDQCVRRNNIPLFYGRILNPENNLPFVDLYNLKTSKYLNCFDYFHSGGTSLVAKKSAIEAVGLYDERFGPGGKYFAAEETDLFFRLLRGGHKMFYCPELIIYHPVCEETHPEKAYKYSYSIGATLARQFAGDKVHSYIYLFIMSKIIFKSFLRTVQCFLLPGLFRRKNRRFHYAKVLTGTIMGWRDCLRDQSSLRVGQ